jgi:hypothetical protein
VLSPPVPVAGPGVRAMPAGPVLAPPRGPRPATVPHEPAPPRPSAPLVPAPVADRWRRARAWVALGAVIAAVYLVGPARFDGDNLYAYATATAIVHHGTLDLSDLAVSPDDPRLMTLDGRRLDFFPWTVALVAVPAVVGLDTAAAAGIGPGSGGLDRAGVLLVEMALGSLLAAAAAVLVGVGAARLSPDRRHRRRVGFAAALMFAFATGTWSTASRSLNQHAPSLLLAAAVLVVAIGIGQASPGQPARPRTGFALGLLVMAAYTIRPTNVLLAVAVAVWLARCHRRLVLPFLAGTATVALPWVAVNGATYAGVLPPYFAGDRLRLHDAFGEALAANLVSPARGLLVFCPLVVGLGAAGTVALVRPAGGQPASLRWLAGLVAGAVVAQWLVVSAFPHWWGGYSYGPRLLTETFAPLAVLAAPALAGLRTGVGRPPVGVLAVVAVLGLWSVGVNAQPAFLPRATCWNATPHIDANPWRVWDWSDPQPLAGARSLLHLSPRRLLASYTEASRC